MGGLPKHWPKIDLLTEHASYMFNVPPSEVTYEQRRYAKLDMYTAIYGVNNARTNEGRNLERTQI